MSETRDTRTTEDKPDDDQGQVPDVASEELSDEQLGRVAGGTSFDPGTIDLGNIPILLAKKDEAVDKKAPETK